jgi:hypothetical protein
VAPGRNIPSGMSAEATINHYKEGLRMSEEKLAYVSIHVRVLKEQYEWLRKYCYENRISQAEVVREALQIFRQKRDNLY